jgi:NADPH2:quinone reductase
MKAIVMNGTGGREMLDYVERPDPVAGPGQALVEVAFAGVNFMDIGVRQGMAWTKKPNPKILGVEGVGRVLDVGDGVEGLAPGERVAWVYAPGSYAQRIAISAASLVPVPDAIDDRTAASVMMQGLTASHFATDFYPVQSGDIAFVHAAAGGLDLLLTGSSSSEAVMSSDECRPMRRSSSRRKREPIMSSSIPRGGSPSRRYA